MEYLLRKKIDHHPQAVDIRKTISLSTKYGCPDLELRFRKYLTDSTQIGLDLIEFDLVTARRLMLWLRYRVIAGSLDVKERIEPSFLVMSEFYNSMSKERREEYLEDLLRKPKPEETDWAHFIYNFVSGLPDPGGVREKFRGDP